MTNDRPNPAPRTPREVLRALVSASRPRTWPAAAAPVLVGSAVARAAGGFRLGPALAALFGALLIQIGTNYVNDVLDFEKGTDTSERLGPTRATQAGWLRPWEVKAAAAAAFGLATAIGGYLVIVAGWPVIAIGLASILSGYAYTGGPFPLSESGWADLFVMVFFGFVAVIGTVYVQTLSVPRLSWGAALPIGALSTAILAVNNTRDLPTDLKAGRRTIPVILGRRGGVLEFAIMMVLAGSAPIFLVAFQWTDYPALLPLVTIPRMVGLTRKLARTEGAALNRTLGQTGQLLLLYSLLFSTGLILGARPS